MKLRILRRGLSAALAVLLALSGVALAGQPALAMKPVPATISVGSSATMARAAETTSSVGGDYGCAGNLIDQRKLVSQWGTLYGYLNLYWDGLVDCAATIHAPGYQGVSLWTTVQVITGNADTGDSGLDEGNYTSYAGPAWAYGVGLCVEAFGYISGVQAEIPWSHCG